MTTFASCYRVNTDGVENLFSQIKWIIRPKRLGSLVFEQALRDWLLGAGKHIPIVKACSVQAVQEEEDPFHFSVYEMEKKEDPFFRSITEDLVMPENEQEESLTVDLDTALTEVIDEIASDTKAVQDLNFPLAEDEKMKFFAGW